jgi:hypothetical protein
VSDLRFSRENLSFGALLPEREEDEAWLRKLFSMARGGEERRADATDLGHHPAEGMAM